MTSSRVAVAADSVCDLPAELAAALGVSVIPTYVNLGGESIPDDGSALDRAQFYRDLPRLDEQPTTAAPSPGDAEAFYRAILDGGAEHIVSVHVPAKLSGVLNAMRLGAEAVGASRVTLVDSEQLTFGIGLQAWAGVETARAGGDGSAVVEAMARVREYTRVYAVIDGVDYLRRSGRVNPLVASLGELLRIKPIIEVKDSEVKSIGRQRAWKRATAKLRALTRAQAPLDRLAILHTANRGGAERFLESIHDIAPSDTLIIEATPTLGAHIGPGALGAATLNRNWRR